MEKLHSGKPKIVKLEGKLAEKWGEGTMVIPAPIDVDRAIRHVPAGRVMTIGQLRKILAKHYGTTIACPLTTGIFVKIAAFAAEEMRSKGEKNITPYWRIVKNDGSIDKKLPLSDFEIAEILRSEGVTVIQKGKKFVVKDPEKFLVEELESQGIE